ncbi:MAG: DUF3021 family protein [Eubacterium sp.]|nr:DUF3021 family protein [Eubacterium sp.]
MKIKDRFAEAFRLYFILFTLISILLMVVGLLFDRERTFSYEVFLSPLVYAAIGVIPDFIFQSDKEISMKRMIIRRVIQVLIVETAMMLIVFAAPNIPSDRIEVVISIAVGILVVFVLSQFVEYIFELTQSRKMNESLEKYQQNNHM